MYCFVYIRIGVVCTAGRCQAMCTARKTRATWTSRTTPAIAWMYVLYYSSTTTRTIISTTTTTVLTLPYIGYVYYLIQAALAHKSLSEMAGCWSSGTAYDNFPKSSDFAGMTACCLLTSVLATMCVLVCFCLSTFCVWSVCMHIYIMCVNISSFFYESLLPLLCEPLLLPLLPLHYYYHCRGVPLPLQPLVLRRHEGRRERLDQE